MSKQKWFNPKSWTKETKIGVLAGVSDLSSKAADVYSSYQSLRADADTFRTQSRLRLYEAEQEAAYDNLALGKSVWEHADYKKEFGGEQMAAWANSGFTDFSSGDERLTTDTKRKIDRSIETLNRNAQIRHFERNKAARMEAFRLQFAAKAAEKRAKRGLIWDSLSAITGSTMTGLGAYALAGGTFSKNDDKGADVSAL